MDQPSHGLGPLTGLTDFFTKPKVGLTGGLLLQFLHRAPSSQPLVDGNKVSYSHKMAYWETHRPLRHQRHHHATSIYDTLHKVGGEVVQDCDILGKLIDCRPVYPASSYKHLVGTGDHDLL